MNPQIRPGLPLIIILSLIIGGTAGIFTSALTNNFLSEYTLELSALTEPLRLSAERPRNFPQSLAEALGDVKAKALPGVAEFYASKTGRAGFDVALEPEMSGLVLTSDGWLLTFPAPGQKISTAHIVVQNQSYTAKEIVPDPVSGAVFVKIDSQNLPVVAFGRGLSLSLGEQIFVLTGREALVSARLSGVRRAAQLQQSSDLPERRYYLDQDRLSFLPGAPVINLAGEFVGLVAPDASGRALVIPNELILSAFTSLLRQGSIKHASLGVKYADLSHAVSLSSSIRRGHEHGALLWDNFYAPVPAGSAAAISGLKANDIILSVNGRPLNRALSLSEALIEYRPGDLVVLSLDRGGEIKDFSVTLQARR